MTAMLPCHVAKCLPSTLVPRSPDLGPKWVRLARNGTNPGLSIRLAPDIPNWFGHDLTTGVSSRDMKRSRVVQNITVLIVLV